MSLIKQANEILRKIGLKAVEVKLEQMILPDGVTTIEAEVFEAGQPVFVITEDAQIALPVGKYELEDGRTLVVVEEGIIGEIREAAAEEEATTEEEPLAEEETEMSEPTPTQPKRTIESIVKETVFSKVEEQQAEIEKLKAELAALKTTEVELAADDAPAAEPINYNPEREAAKEVFRIASNRQASTLDRVLAAIAN
jgi:hypothetical protein